MKTNIYFIQSGGNGAIKIGEAVNVEERLKQLQVGNPEQLFILKILKHKPKTFETKLHKHFKNFHIKGEWYSNEIKELINEFN